MINLDSSITIIQIMINDIRDMIEEEERQEITKYLESAVVQLTIAFSDLDSADQLINKDYGEEDADI